VYYGQNNVGWIHERFDKKPERSRSGQVPAILDRRRRKDREFTEINQRSTP
jgi:hypothetical protein